VAQLAGREDQQRHTHAFALFLHWLAHLGEEQQYVLGALLRNVPQLQALLQLARHAGGARQTNRTGADSGGRNTVGETSVLEVVQPGLEATPPAQQQQLTNPQHV
jgi:hypothetical protein